MSICYTFCHSIKKMANDRWAQIQGKKFSMDVAVYTKRWKNLKDKCVQISIFTVCQKYSKTKPKYWDIKLLIVRVCQKYWDVE